MWLFARPIESTWPLASQTGTSHQNGFSMSIQTPAPAWRRASATNVIGEGYSRLGAGQVERPAEVEVEQGPAAALVLAAQDVVIAVAVEPDQGVGWELLGAVACAVPQVPVQLAVVPPGDHRRDVQVLGPHQQGDLGDRPMHVQLARPPALLGEIGQSLELDLDLHRCRVPGREPAARPGILRPAFDLVGIVSRGDLKPRSTGASEVIAPERQDGRPLRLAGCVDQVNTARDRLARFPVEYRELDQAGTVLGFGRASCKGAGQRRASPREHRTSLALLASPRCGGCDSL